MHVTFLQKSARGYVNVVKDRMEQRVIVSTKSVKLNTRWNKDFIMYKRNDVMMTDLKNVIGMKSGKLMGISAMYNFRSDQDTGIGNLDIRRIPCACNGCLEQLDSVWKTGTVDK